MPYVREARRPERADVPRRLAQPPPRTERRPIAGGAVGTVAPGDPLGGILARAALQRSKVLGAFFDPLAELDAADDSDSGGDGADWDEFEFDQVTSDEFRDRHCVDANLEVAGLQAAVARIHPPYSTSILFDDAAQARLTTEWADRMERGVYEEGRAYATDDEYRYVSYRRIGRGNSPGGWTRDSVGRMQFRYTVSQNGNHFVISHFHKMGTGAGRGLDKVDPDTDYSAGLRGASHWFA